MSRYTEGQIIGFIKQAESGLAVEDLCRKGGFSDATFYKWRAEYGGMDVPDAKRLRDLDAESDKLKKILAEAHPAIHALNTAFGVGDSLASQACRRRYHDLIERRACSFALLGDSGHQIFVTAAASNRHFSRTAG